MKNISPKHRVLDHIDNVRDWLSRAEDGYKRGASVQGEMNLNLAQAELKKAWEESRDMHKEAQASSKVVPLPNLQQTPATVRPVVANKRGAFLVQYRFGLVAAVVLLLMMNLVPLLQGLPLGQTVRTDASPVNESQLVAQSQSPEGIISEPLPTATNEFIAYADERAYAGQVITDATLTDSSKALSQADASATTGKTARSGQSTDSKTPFRFDGKNGQTAQTPTKEVKSEESTTKPINHAIALNAKSLRSSGNRVDTLFTSGTTGTVKAVTDSTPARATETGLAITATDAATNTRTSDPQNTNLALSRAAVSTEEMPINVNTTWSTGPSFSYTAYSNTSGSSSQSSVNSSIAKSGVKAGATTSNAAVVTFDFDALVNLATEVLYTNQQ